MIVLDFNVRNPKDATSSSGCIAWLELLKIRDEGEYQEAYHYRRFISGERDDYLSSEILIKMNKCINLPNRLCTRWRTRVVARLLEM